METNTIIKPQVHDIIYRRKDGKRYVDVFRITEVSSDGRIYGLYANTTGVKEWIGEYLYCTSSRVAM